MFKGYFDSEARTFPFKWRRTSATRAATVVHFDKVYMGRGSQKLHTCWVPFGDLTPEIETLAICEGSHRNDDFDLLRETYGEMGVDQDEVKGDGVISGFSNNPVEIVEGFGGRWLASHFHAGDFITFRMCPLHVSTNNVSDVMRISYDVRYQPANEVIDKRWVGHEHEP